MLIAIESLGHGERRKDIFGCKFRQRFPTDALDDDRKQKISRIAIEIFRAGIEVERFLTGDDSQCILVGGDAVYVDASELEERQIIADSTCVIEQIEDGDFLAVVGEFRDVFADIVVNGELPFLFEQENARGGELLGSGADIKDGARSDGNLLFEVREAVALFVDDFAASRNGEGASG